MALAAPIVGLALLMLLAFGVFGLRRAGVSGLVITGGAFLVAGALLGVAAIVEANRPGAPDGVVNAILAAGCVVASARLLVHEPRA